MSDGTDQTIDLPRPGDPPPQVAAALTAPIGVSPPAFASRQIALVFCAVAAASFLVGIALATASRPRTDQTVVVSEDVGPDGKTIAFDGGEIDFPRGAVDRTVRIVVRRAPVTDRFRIETAEDEPDVVQPDDLVAYSFEPTDLAFQEPVEITFQLPPGASNAAVFARRGDAVVLLTGTVDPGDGTATAIVRDFRFEGRRR